jgi:hypothetical protein
MKKPKSGVSISKLQVLQAISDPLSLELLEAVPKKAATSDDYMQMLDISRKQLREKFETCKCRLD